MNRPIGSRSLPRTPHVPDPGDRQPVPRTSARQWLHRTLGFAVLAGVAVAAAAGIAAGEDRPHPPLGIGARPAAAPTTEPADDGPLLGQPRAFDEPLPLEKLPDLLIGDGALRGRIDLSTMERVGDGYEVRLEGGGRARLTLEPDIQQQAQKLLARSRAPMAAIVAMTPDGRILALAGRRHGPPTEENDYKLATTVWAPAASVFKLVTAAALLQAGVAASRPVCFHGGIRSVLRSNLIDDPRRDRQCEDLTFAVAESQNAIIAKLAHKFLDGKKLTAAANAFGLGKAAVFSLDCEASRFTVPDDELEQARFAAGFWSSELSVVDGALLAGVVATGGMRVTPRIVSEVTEKNGKTRSVVAVAPERVISKRVAAEVGRMMVQTTERGTAYTAFHDRRGRVALRGIKVAGKTGSLARDRPSYLGYSWFVGYAPSDTPEVIVSVLFGNPETWHLKAHTAARLLLEVALPLKSRGRRD